METDVFEVERFAARKCGAINEPVAGRPAYFVYSAFSKFDFSDLFDRFLFFSNNYEDISHSPLQLRLSPSFHGDLLFFFFLVFHVSAIVIL